MNHSEDRDKTATGTDARNEALVWLTDYGDDMMGFAMARVGDVAVAEELVQETFLAAVRGFGKFEQRSTPKTWLFGILRRKIVDHIRARSRQRRDEQRDDSLEAAGPFPKHGKLSIASGWPSDPAAALENAEFWQMFDSCLGKLRDVYAEAFQMRVMDGMDSLAVCRALDISAKNLSARLHRARLGLRQCLEKNWFTKET
jgi:RNA polymerase sigma-70 factor (ECF subfamily)